MEQSTSGSWVWSSFAVTKKYEVSMSSDRRNSENSASKKHRQDRTSSSSNSNHPEEHPIDDPDTFIDIIVVIEL